MGNYKFRLSNMMPNAWFYKLKDMSKSRNHHHPTKKNLHPSPNQNPTKSHEHNPIFTSPNNPKSSDTHFPHDPPRKSSNKSKTKTRKTIYKPSPKQITPSSFPVWIKPEPVPIQDRFESSVHDDDFLDHESEFSDCFENHVLLANDQSFNERFNNHSWSSSCSCHMSSSTNHDIIIDMDMISSCHASKIEELPEFNMISEPELPWISTRPKKNNVHQESPNFKNSTSIQENKNFHPKKNSRTVKTITSPSSRKSVSRPGKVKIKGNWKKLSDKKREIGQGKKSLTSENSKGMFYSQSFAIVKASMDPEQDFMDSMMEMIVENNIRASKDLEDLLACYLSLNSNQYHDLIIKAFEQIWFSMPEH